MHIRFSLDLKLNNMKDAKELVKLVLDAHGGVERWNQLKTIKAHLSLGGITWSVKGHEGALADTYFTGNIHDVHDSWSPIFEPSLSSSFDGRNVQLIDKSGSVADELRDARASFEGHTIMTPWSRTQLAYFASYATWNYLTTPFIFALPGFHFLEMDNWNEQGEIWRRLEVIFPDDVPTHSKRQVFYLSQEGLLKRHDYWPEVLGNNSATHIYSDYREFQGIKLPTTHRVYALNDADNSYTTDPLLVSIDIFDVKYT
jgi:hypothetical protein